MLDRQGDKSTDRFGGGDLLLREGAVDVVDQVNHADDPITGDQGEGDQAALAVATQFVALDLVEPRIIQAAHAYRATVPDGEVLGGPIGKRKSLPGPRGIVGAIDRRGSADHPVTVVELVDVTVGDLQGCGEAPRGRLAGLRRVQASRPARDSYRAALVALLSLAGWSGCRLSVDTPIKASSRHAGNDAGRMACVDRRSCRRWTSVASCLH